MDKSSEGDRERMRVKAEHRRKMTYDVSHGTKSPAQGSGSLEGVAFDAVLLSVDKVITSALERHPGTRVCGAIWGNKTHTKGAQMSQNLGFFFSKLGVPTLTFRCLNRENGGWLLSSPQLTHVEVGKGG